MSILTFNIFIIILFYLTWRLSLFFLHLMYDLIDYYYDNMPFNIVRKKK